MTKKKDIIGQVFQCKTGGKYIVLEYIYYKSTEYYYKIKFLDTGKEKIVEKRNLMRGNVRDDYCKNIFGVACKGNANSRAPALNKLAFKRWYAMIERCYNPNAASYKSYGEKGATVDEDWLCFEQFLNDLPQIPGYEENKYFSGSIQLDKDKLVPGNKVYSKQMCQFIPRISNIRYQATKRRKFLAISPEGNQYVFYSQTECAEKFGLTARTIGKVLDGHLKSHKGWTFRYLV